MRILILGVTGMLGHKLWQRLAPRLGDVHATMRGRRVQFAHCPLFQYDALYEGVDATSFAAVAAVLDRVRPDVVVNCIAVTKRRDAAVDPLTSIELNAALPHRLAGWAADHRARVIHFSTDCVFDGREGRYTEDSLTNAQDLYGRTKALGELAAPHTLTLRTSFIGREIGARTELLEWFLAQRGRRIQGYRRAYYTGVSTLYMADLVADLIVRFPALSGLYQVASPVITKYELLGLAKGAYNLEVEIVADDSVVVHRDLDGTRFRLATGIEVPPWHRMIQALAEDPTPYDRWSTRDAA
ncbi:MAG: SDR family oxidoreductase [Burkholderiales bacterium]|nr:SDR family oxidoreductase [Burkholderiales bacterium]